MYSIIRTRLEQLYHDRAGVSAIEFAIVASVLAPLLLAAYDFGNAAQEQIQLQQVVRAAGAYAMSFPTDPTGISNAALSALPSGWTLSSPPTVTCSCLNPSTGATTSTVCTAPTCVAPMDAKIVTITAKMPYVTLSPQFASAITSNTATYVVRYQ